MKQIVRQIGRLLIAVVVTACAATQHQELGQGIWRGEFTVSDKKIPFNFSVEHKGASTTVSLLNAEERAELDSVYYKEDSVVIAIDIYDALLVARVEGDAIKGYLRKNQVPRKGLAFSAVRNQNFRFETSGKQTSSSVQGKWSVNLTSETDGKPSKRYTVGLLNQTGNKVTGTILTTTGDYRYLEGLLDGTKLKLSAFSGSGPSLIEADLTDDQYLKGEYISAGGKVTLEAIKSDTAKLPDAYSLTYLKDGFDKLNFSFPNLDGKQISLTDKKYQGKVVVLTILGSWCPNCVDEAEFLGPWYKKNKYRGVEIVGLSFERKDDLNFAKARLNTMIKRFDLQYDILFGGVADKKIVAEKLPELNTFLSFPTTFFIDRQGKVRKVHTGYTGPATGQHYDDFIQEFNHEVDVLVAEGSEHIEHPVGGK